MPCVQYPDVLVDTLGDDPIVKHGLAQVHIDQLFQLVPDCDLLSPQMLSAGLD